MAAGLPWERESGAAGVGICLSGGGVRAAAFAFGAVQTLQEDLQLLRGPDVPIFSWAFQAGSYVAAATTVIASQQAPRQALDRLRWPRTRPSRFI